MLWVRNPPSMSNTGQQATQLQPYTINIWLSKTNSSVDCPEHLTSSSHPSHVLFGMVLPLPKLTQRRQALHSSQCSLSSHSASCILTALPLRLRPLCPCESESACSSSCTMPCQHLLQIILCVAIRHMLKKNVQVQHAKRLRHWASLQGPVYLWK